MDPMFCLNGSSSNPLCVLQLGELFVIPFFYHLGQSFDKPDRCVCSSLTSTELEDRSNPCHKFNFLTGFFFWNTVDITPLLEVLNSTVTVAEFVDSGFEAAFWSSSFGLASNVSHNTSAAFDFCRGSAGACSVFVISSYDVHEQGSTISQYYYQLDRGACRDSFSLPYSAQ
jgi:hypothetical protein